MARIPWLADAARATGYPVTEVAGWETRGTTTFNPQGLLWHHTAGKATGDMPSLPTLINGRTDLPGPLSQYGLGRSGTIYVVAGGLASHAGEGDWHGLIGNRSVIGIEAEHTGISGVPWPAPQLDAYRKLSAQILARLGSTIHLMCAHREWARNRTTKKKVDPIDLNMDTERARVAALMVPTGDDDMSLVARLMVVEAGSKAWLSDQAAIDYWMLRADNLDDPVYAADWRTHFEQAWAGWKQDEWSQLQGHPHGPPGSGAIDQAARDAAANAQTSADQANEDLAEIKSVIG